MHFVLATVGTEGDVRPFVALALGLVKAGHRCTVATHDDYEGMVTGRGLGFRRIGASFKKLVESEAGRRWIDSGDSLVRYVRTTRETFEPHFRSWMEDAYHAALDADVVLAHVFAIGATFAAEKNGGRAMLVSLPPLVPSGEHPPVFYPTAPRSRWLRRMLTGFANRSVCGPIIPHLDALRAAAEVSPFGAPDFVSFALARRMPILHLYSTSLVPRPSDWPDLVSATGFCFLGEDGWTPPGDLVAFVERGSKPIYVGFGSMTGKDPESLATLAIAAVRRAGERAVLATGWGGARGAISGREDVYVTDRVPHEWLFPRVKAVVHHGGAGTTAAGLRAGRPTLVVAFFGDQPYWGHRVAAIGAGPKPLLKRKLGVESLARAVMHTVSTPPFASSAARTAEALSREDGVASAVRRVLSLASDDRSTSGRQ